MLQSGARVPLFAAWESLELKALAPLELLLGASFPHSEIFFLHMGNFLWHCHCFPIWPKTGDGSQPWFTHLKLLPPGHAPTSSHSQSHSKFRLWQSWLGACFPPQFKNYSKMLRPNRIVSQPSLTFCKSPARNTSQQFLLVFNLKSFKAVVGLCLINFWRLSLYGSHTSHFLKCRALTKSSDSQELGP